MRLNLTSPLPDIPLRHEPWQYGVGYSSPLAVKRARTAPPAEVLLKGIPPTQPTASSRPVFTMRDQRAPAGAPPATEQTLSVKLRYCERMERKWRKRHEAQEHREWETIEATHQRQKEFLSAVLRRAGMKVYSIQRAEVVGRMALEEEQVTAWKNLLALERKRLGVVRRVEAAHSDKIEEREREAYLNDVAALHTMVQDEIRQISMKLQADSAVDLSTLDMRAPVPCTKRLAGKSSPQRGRSAVLSFWARSRRDLGRPALWKECGVNPHIRSARLRNSCPPGDTQPPTSPPVVRVPTTEHETLLDRISKASTIPHYLKVHLPPSPTSCPPRCDPLDLVKHGMATGVSPVALVSELMQRSHVELLRRAQGRPHTGGRVSYRSATSMRPPSID